MEATGSASLDRAEVSAGRDWHPAAWFLGVAIAVLTLTWPTWVGLSGVWRNVSGYSHGLLVAPIAVWLAWRALAERRQGNIHVFPGAQRTDAYQASRNLSLSNSARADSIPGLEIEADDVRCTHGAAISQVDREEVFYLMTRGIPEKIAEQLIVNGFFKPVLDRIPMDNVRARLEASFAAKMGLAE